MLDVYTLLDSVKEIPGDIRYFISDIDAAEDCAAANQQCDTSTESSCKALTTQFLQILQEDLDYDKTGRRFSISVGSATRTVVDSDHELPAPMPMSPDTPESPISMLPTPPPPIQMQITKSKSASNTVVIHPMGIHINDSKLDLIPPIREESYSVSLKKSSSFYTLKKQQSFSQKKEELRKQWKMGNLRRASLSASVSAISKSTGNGHGLGKERRNMTASTFLAIGATGRRSVSKSYSISRSRTYSTMATKIADALADELVFEDTVVDDSDTESSVESMNIEVSETEANDTRFQFENQLTPFNHMRDLTDLSGIQESPEDSRNTNAPDRNAYSHDFSSCKDNHSLMEIEMSFSNGLCHEKGQNSERLPLTFDLNEIDESESERTEPTPRSPPRRNHSKGLSSKNLTPNTRTKKEVRFRNMKSLEYYELAEQDENAGNEMATVRIQIADAAASPLAVTPEAQEVVQEEEEEEEEVEVKEFEDDNVRQKLTQIITSNADEVERDMKEEELEDVHSDDLDPESDDDGDDMYILDEDEDEKTCHRDRSVSPPSLSPLSFTRVITCGLMGKESSPSYGWRRRSGRKLSNSYGRMPYLEQSVSKHDFNHSSVELEDADIEAAIDSAHTPSFSRSFAAACCTSDDYLSDSATADEIKLQFQRNQKVRGRRLMSGNRSHSSWGFGLFCT